MGNPKFNVTLSSVCTVFSVFSPPSVMTVRLSTSQVYKSTHWFITLHTTTTINTAFTTYLVALRCERLLKAWIYVQVVMCLSIT